MDSTELRRHVTPGQRAMGYAMRHPKPEKGGRGKKLAGNGEFSGVPHQRVSEARAVLAYSLELAEAVMHGSRSPVSPTRRDPASQTTPGDHLMVAPVRDGQGASPAP